MTLKEKLAPRRRKIADLTLKELYEQEKITPSVMKNLIFKEDFREIRRPWCERVCKLPEPMKLYNLIDLRRNYSDVVLLQDSRQPGEKYRTAGQVNASLERIFFDLCSNSLPEGTTVQILDLFKCPYRKDDGGYLKITGTMMKACTQYTLEELRQIQPRAIIATSTDCLKALGIKANHKASRGHFYYTDLPGLPPTPVLVTFHPRILPMIRQVASGASWGHEFYTLIQRDMQKIPLLITGELKMMTTERLDEIIADQVAVAGTLTEVQEMCELLLSLPRNRVISWDTETTSLDPWSSDARILTHQFGYRRPDGKIQALVIPMWHKDTPYDPDLAAPMVEEVLTCDIPKVGHNAKFDYIFTEVTTGVKVQALRFDTMLMLHAVNSGVRGSYSLKDATWDIIPELGMGGYEDRLDESLDPELMKRLAEEEKHARSRLPAGETLSDDDDSDLPDD